MSRAPRGVCPALTRTEQLRQAKTAAALKNIAQKEELAAKQQTCRQRRRMMKPEPKRVDFTKPGMTKAMLARMKQAEKLKQEYERKQDIATRAPRRTAAPIGGDARMGREASRVRHPQAGPSRGQGRSTISKRTISPEQLLPRKTTELAKVMNADIIQAEQVGPGPVTNIIIPPGVISEEHTTIVNVVPASSSPQAGGSQAANRSIQVISESLNEQDATESAAVQNKLADLQQARRDFVIAIANVGGNSVNIEDEPPCVPDSLPITSKRAMHHAAVPRVIVKLPDVEDKYLKPEFGLDHPDIVAARAHIDKIKRDLEARQAAKRMNEEFEKLAAAEQLSEQVQLDVPYEDEIYLEQGIPWDEDEAGVPTAQAPLIPVPQQPYKYEPFDVEELERFFDLQGNPPCARCGAPPGRENLHPDLWELEDPWEVPFPCDAPDLIQFD